MNEKTPQDNSDKTEVIPPPKPKPEPSKPTTDA